MSRFRLALAFMPQIVPSNERSGQQCCQFNLNRVFCIIQKRCWLYLMRFKRWQPLAECQLDISQQMSRIAKVTSIFLPVAFLSSALFFITRQQCCFDVYGPCWFQPLHLYCFFELPCFIGLAVAQPLRPSSHCLTWFQHAIWEPVALSG